jgi:hypothetical protein
MKLTTITIALCLVGAAAQAQLLLDNFNQPGLGDYTQTTILDNGVAEANVSFSDASGGLVGSYSGTINQPEQVLLLRNDLSLGVGFRLLVDVLFPTQTSQMDFGLAVSATVSPTAASLADTDTRDTFNWASIYVRPSQNAVRTTASISGAVNTATGVLAADETSVSQLFIERNSATTFTLGYYDANDTRFVSRSAVFAANDVGTAIGFYGDLRAVGGTLGMLDNLSIGVIPEPSVSILAGFGLLALAARLRRRN